MQIFLELKHYVKSLMEKVLIADLVHAYVHRMTVCFRVFSFCGTAIPCPFYRVLLERAVSISSMGIYVGMHVEFCRFVE